MQRLEHRNVVSRLRQIARTGQTRRAAAYDRHAMAVRGSFVTALAVVFQTPVAHIPLQLADSHGLALDAENARTLALRLLRAYASTDARQRAVLGYDGRCRRHVALQHLADESGNIYTHGARRDASRVLAPQTSRSLCARLLAVVPVTHLVEIGCTHARILLAHAHARNLICHNNRIYVFR